MSKLRKLAGLPLPDLLCLAEASGVTLAVEVLLRLCAPSRCLAIAARRRVPRSAGAREDPARLARLVGIADRYVPGRSTCLRRALALSWLLGRRGVGASLRIGVARDGRSLLAHAWVETDGGVSLGAAGDHDYACLPLLAAPARRAMTRAAR